MAELVTQRPLRLAEDDLLSILRPRALVSFTALTFLFAAVCLLAGAGKWLLLGVVGLGAVLAVLSPEYAFALCIFMFAFRNEAFSLGPLKIADPLYAITAFCWLVHLFYRGKLRLHMALLVVGIYACTDILSGLAARSVGAYAGELIRQMYLISIFVLATQIMGNRKTFLLCVKAFLAAGLVMALCSYAGLIDKFVLHGSGAPFFDVSIGGHARFGFCSIAVETERVPSYLIFPMAMMAGLQSLARTRYERWISGVLFWVGFGACALSFSRASVLYIVAALVVMWVLTRHHLSKLMMIAAALAAVLLFVTFIPPDSPLVEQYNLQRWAVAGKLTQEHQEPRAVVWDTCLRAFRSSPIIGIGLDNVLARSMEFRDPWLAYGILQYLGKPPHSAYIGALAETGIVGTIALLIMLGYLLQLGRRGVRAARLDGDRARYVLAAAVFAGFVAQLAGALTFQVFTSNHVWVRMSFLIPLGRFVKPAAPEAAAEEPVAPAAAAVG